MYESGIGLNLNSSAASMELSNSEFSITELYSINAAITKEQQEQYENAVPRKYTSRPTAQKEKFDDSKFYHFVLFDIETNSTGKSAEVCLLAAVDRSDKQFSCYILPNRGERNVQLNFFPPYFFRYFSPSSLIFSGVSPSFRIFHLSP